MPELTETLYSVAGHWSVSMDMDGTVTYVRTTSSSIEETVISLQLMARRRFANFGSEKLIELKLFPVFLQMLLPKLVDMEYREKLSQVLEEITLMGGLYFRYGSSYDPYFAMGRVSAFMKDRETNGPSREYKVKISNKHTEMSLQTIFKNF